MGKAKVLVSMQKGIKSVDIERVKEFILPLYRPSRLKERNSGYWEGYIDDVAENHMRYLDSRGWSLISHHDSMSGQTVIFDKDLNIIESDVIEHPKQDMRLTHIF